MDYLVTLGGKRGNLLLFALNRDLVVSIEKVLCRGNNNLRRLQFLHRKRLIAERVLANEIQCVYYVLVYVIQIGIIVIQQRIIRIIKLPVIKQYLTNTRFSHIGTVFYL